MTDEQIIKALEYCKIGECDDCPFYGVKEDCEVEILEEALNVIYRKKAEIEQEIKEIKSEAIKEFAERLEGMILLQLISSPWEKKRAYFFCLDGIDKIVKEMTEVQK